MVGAIWAVSTLVVLTLWSMPFAVDDEWDVAV
jgi:hypothetical protein